MKEQTEKRTTETEQPKQNINLLYREQTETEQTFKGDSRFKGFQYIKTYIKNTTEKIQQQQTTTNPQTHKKQNLYKYAYIPILMMIPKLNEITFLKVGIFPTIENKIYERWYIWIVF